MTGKPEWNLSTIILASMTIPIGLTGFGMIERKKKKSLPFSKLDQLFAENDFEELWHPRMEEVPRNASSLHFSVKRELSAGTMTSAKAPFAKTKKSEYSHRKRHEMQKTQRSEDSGRSKRIASPSRTHSRLWGGVSMMGLLCLLGTLLISGSLFWMAAPESEQTPAIAASTLVPITHKKIQDIQPGQWVKAENPAEEDDLEFGSSVDPIAWKLLTLDAPKLDGTTARVQLIRPTFWLTLQQAAEGGNLYISVPECGIQGDAKLLKIDDCPPIKPRPGPGFQIVTGTFQHEAAQTLDISVEDESKPIGTTPNHPIWSVDRQEFVRADSLTV